MDSNEKAMYTGVTASRNTEVALRWRRGEIFLVIHSGAFSFMFTRMLEKGLLITMSLLGITLGLVWLLANVQTQRWINFWHQRIENIERAEEDPLNVKIYASRRFRKVSTSIPTFHQILMFLSITATVAWFAVLVYALTR